MEENENKLIFAKDAISILQHHSYRDKKIIQYFTDIYHNPEKNRKEFEYYIIDDDIHVKMFDNEYIPFDSQIKSISGELKNDYINYRKTLDIYKVVEFAPNYHIECNGGKIYLKHDSIPDIYLYFTQHDGFTDFTFKHEKDITFVIDERCNRCLIRPFYYNKSYKYFDWDYLPSSSFMDTEEKIKAFYELKTALCYTEGE